MRTRSAFECTSRVSSSTALSRCIPHDRSFRSPTLLSLFSSTESVAATCFPLSDASSSSSDAEHDTSFSSNTVPPSPDRMIAETPYKWLRALLSEDKTGLNTVCAATSASNATTMCTLPGNATFHASTSTSSGACAQKLIRHSASAAASTTCGGMSMLGNGTEVFKAGSSNGMLA